MSLDAFSRRGWILRLGGAAILRGMRATDLDAAEPLRLPPGLYEPSLQHLAHSLKANTEPASEPLSPAHFSQQDFVLLKTLVARILGEEPLSPVVLEIAVWIDRIVGCSEEVRMAARSLSPAHRRLAVDYYGEDTVRELESERPEALCRDGLADLRHAGFETMENSAQVTHLTNLEDASAPFIVWMKRRILDGFYTSRKGLQELNYKGNAFYAESPGCDHDNRHQ